MPARISATSKSKSALRAKKGTSWSVTEIVAAATQLRPNAFLRLREKLDEVEEQQWRSSLARITKQTRAKGIGDEQIDAMAMRRRRENRR